MQVQTDQFELQAAKLYNAALEGNVPALTDLFQQDPLILDRLSYQKHENFTKTPLHLSAELGHLEFTTQILLRKPKMCFVRDSDGRNPLHVAAINGHVGVLVELVWATPQAARERTSNGETLLHLCVKYDEPKGLERLLEELDDGELLNSGDSDGNTVLHLAVAARQVQVVKLLTKDKRLEINAINKNGFTAMDTFTQSKKDNRDKSIYSALRRAHALKAKEALDGRNKQRHQLDDHRNGLMVVASLIATMAFAIGISPPGGTWQDNNEGHTAGMANAKENNLLFDQDSSGIGQYHLLLTVNTLGLVSSLSVILLLISGLPCKRLFIGMLTVIMWIAVTATALSYILAVDFLMSSQKLVYGTGKIITYFVLVWVGITILLLVAHAFRFIMWLARKLYMCYTEGLISTIGQLTLLPSLACPVRVTIMLM